MALIDTITADLKRLEGFRQFVYDDATGNPLVKGSEVHGYPTVGYGRRLDAHGITEPEASQLLANDVAAAVSSVRSKLPHFEALTEDRQAVLVEMAFQMGVVGLLKFQKMLAAIDEGDFTEAASEMLASAWATQTPARAKELASRMIGTPAE